MQNEANQTETVESQLQEVDDEHQEKGSNIHTEYHSDGINTKRVMEDLDALLADLQSTTAHISSYQAGQQPQQQQQQHYFQTQRQFSNPYSEPYEDYNSSSGSRINSNHNGSSNSNNNRQQPPYPNNRYNNGVVNYNQQPPLPPQHQHSTGVYRQVSSSGGYQEQGQGHSRDPGSVVTVKRVSYGSSDDGGGHSGSSTPPPLPPPPPSEVLDSLAFAGGGVGPDEIDGPVYQQQSFSGGGGSGGGGGGGVIHRQGSAKGRGERMSALSNNLSELDQLLQDLNSAQFMAEVDRKSSNIIKVLNYLEDQNEAEAKGQPRRHGVNEVTAVVNGGPVGRAPAAAPKPARTAPQRTSVDNLLDELEAATPQPGRFPVEPFDPHYQELSTVSTQYHQQQPQQQQQQQQRLPQQQQHSHLHTGNNGSPYLPASSSSTSSSSSYHHPQTASTATRELDELMNSLSEFKLQNTDEIDPEPAYAKPIKSRSASEASPTTPQGNGNFPPQMMQQQNQQQQGPQENGQLESMLGDLESDMNRQGVNTKQKGVCAACQKAIVGQVIAALGKTWHVEHFCCAHCEEPLGTRNFYERDSLAYCETDYHHLFAPRCAYCNGPIVDKCIEALNKMWHPEHFFCAHCGRPFGEEDFHEKDGKAYCREHYFQMFAPKCGGCALPIMENYISALNRQWHPECFVCWECRAPFGAGSFFDYEGLPYCEKHYHAKKGSLCASCEKPITGRCITAMFKKFHPEHFVCAFCLKQLNKGTFKEQNDKPYCHPCFVKLFG